MIERWNSVVSSNDTVYHLGDFCFCKRGESYEEVAMNYLSKLNGRVILVLGNHDRDAGTMRRCGFFEVHDKLILDREDTKIIMTHRRITDLPTMNCSVEVHGYTPFPLPTTMVWTHLCGHVHDKWFLKFGGVEEDRKEINK